MPKEFEYLGFAKLAKEIGSDIITLKFFGTTIIVLNTAQPAFDLFEKRSAIYSNRVCPPALGESSLMNWGNFVSFVGYTDLWKKYRRMMHIWLNKQAVPAFHSSQQHQARVLLQRLLENAKTLGTSEELGLQFYRTIAATLLQSVYGYDLQRLDDPFVLGAKEAIGHIAKAASPSKDNIEFIPDFLVNVAPALARVPSWLPGTGWKSTLQEWGRHKDIIVEGTFGWTKAHMAAGGHETSVVASLLENVNSWGQDETAIQEVAFGIYAVRPTALNTHALYTGGTDTVRDLYSHSTTRYLIINEKTVNTLIVFVLAMLLFPDAQAKAQQEIDTVIGTSRLPTIDDQACLPYVGRLIQEVLRWQPVTPTASNRAPNQRYHMYAPRITSIADTCFPAARLSLVTFGKQIEAYLHSTPADRTYSRIRAMTRDERVYKDPETFNPDRFLDPSVPAAPGFGWGRRICPGVHYANSSLFVTIASILATFDITLRTDELGHKIVPTTESAQNTVAYHPKPFKCKFTPRSDLHAELIRSGA
ncbi:hypothetical protein FRC10_007133 [Ceratobasidium sp. 414]|nr:hypothetical protein FRC10_007133 [Ceratobasidium sp. 414]